MIYPDTDASGKWVSVTKAAGMLGRSFGETLALARVAAIYSKKDSFNRWWLMRVSVERYVSRHGKGVVRRELVAR